MADPTQEDRDRAKAIVKGLAVAIVLDGPVVSAIAQALAEERERTVLAVAEQSEALFERAKVLCDRADANFKRASELVAKAIPIRIREQERAAVVAWLRTETPYRHYANAEITRGLADAIERGEHLK